MDQIKALSIRQPWAWLILHAGKDIENRSWNTTRRGTIYIHASSKLDGDKIERERIRAWVRNKFGIVVPDDDAFQLGGIVGKVCIVDVVTKSWSPWFRGPCGFVLKNARPTRFLKCNGQLGFFNAT